MIDKLQADCERPLNPTPAHVRVLIDAKAEVAADDADSRAAIRVAITASAGIRTGNIDSDIDKDPTPDINTSVATATEKKLLKMRPPLLPLQLSPLCASS